MGKMNDLKVVFKAFDTKKIEEEFLKRKKAQDECDHFINCLKNIPLEEINKEFNFCPKCGAVLKK